MHRKGGQSDQTATGPPDGQGTARAPLPDDLVQAAHHHPDTQQPVRRRIQGAHFLEYRIHQAFANRELVHPSRPHFFQHGLDVLREPLRHDGREVGSRIGDLRLDADQHDLLRALIQFPGQLEGP